MEGLIVLIIMAVVSNLFSKNKKKSGAAPKAAGKGKVGNAVERLERWLDEQEEQSAEPSTPVEQQPAARAVDRKAELIAKYGNRIRHGEGSGEASFEGVSRPLAPSAELTAGRAAGSITFHSEEGMDVCDPTLLHGESGLEMPETPAFPAHAEDEPFLTAGDLVRGIVVSEILARPSAGRMTRMR